MGDTDYALSQKIFNVPVTKVESVIQPDSTGNDIWRQNRS